MPYFPLELGLILEEYQYGEPVAWQISWHYCFWLFPILSLDFFPYSILYHIVSTLPEMIYFNNGHILRS